METSHFLGESDFEALFETLVLVDDVVGALGVVVVDGGAVADFLLQSHGLNLVFEDKDATLAVEKVALLEGKHS